MIMDALEMITSFEIGSHWENMLVNDLLLARLHNPDRLSGLGQDYLSSVPGWDFKAVIGRLPIQFSRDENSQTLTWCWEI